MTLSQDSLPSNAEITEKKQSKALFSILARVYVEEGDGYFIKTQKRKFHSNKKKTLARYD